MTPAKLSMGQKHEHRQQMGWPSRETGLGGRREWDYGRTLSYTKWINNEGLP